MIYQHTNSSTVRIHDPILCSGNPVHIHFILCITHWNGAACSQTQNQFATTCWRGAAVAFVYIISIFLAAHQPLAAWKRLAAMCAALCCDSAWR